MTPQRTPVWRQARPTQPKVAWFMVQNVDMTMSRFHHQSESAKTKAISSGGNAIPPSKINDVCASCFKTGTSNNYNCKLKDFYFKSAYNCFCSGIFRNDYVDMCAVNNCAKSGVRFFKSLT